MARKVARCWIDGEAYESSARQAVIEEATEITRMEAALRSRQSCATEHLGLIRRQAETIAGLHRELDARLAVIEQQRAALARARCALLLVAETRLYKAMRTLGRWDWLEQRIRHALR